MNRIALVIGNGLYADGGALDNLPTDAVAIAARVSRIGFSGITPNGDDFDCDLADQPPLSGPG